MGFQTLTEDQLAVLTEEQFAVLTEEASGGTTGCLYDATAIAAIKTVVDALASSLSSLTTKVNTLQSDLTTVKTDLTAVKNRVNAIPTTTYTVPTAAQNANAVWSASTRTLTTSTGGGATAQDVWEYANRTITSGIPTVSEIQSGLAKTSDLSALAMASALSTVDTVVDAIKAKTDNLTAQPAAKTDVQITVNADGIDVPTVSEIWNHSSRTLTSEIPTVSEIQNGLAKTSDLTHLATSTALANVQTTANTIKTQTDKIPATSVTPSDLTALRTHGDANWTTASGFATPDDVTLTTTTETVNVTTQTVDLSSVTSALSTITALLDNWSVSGNVLTVRNSNGTTLKTYTLTRDADGNIIGIVENGG